MVLAASVVVVVAVTLVQERRTEGALTKLRDLSSPRALVLRDAPAAITLRSQARLEQRYPFGEGFLAMCHGWREDSGAVRIAMKGAPETVLGLCALEPEARDAAQGEVAVAAERGLRLLAVASAPFEGHWPESPSGLRLSFLGVIALASLLAAVYIPAVAAIFRLAPLPFADFLVAAGAGFASVAWYELYKVARRH